MEPGTETCEVTAVDPVRPSPEVLDALGTRLRDGALVAFPTETVYGLGASIERPDAVARIFSVKGRPGTDPLIVHVPAIEALDGVVASIPAVARDLADAFWPGPLTLVLERGPIVGDVVTAGGPTVGVRVPSHPVATGLLRAAGAGVAAPSANRFGRISPTSADDVVEELGTWMDRSDVILDGGPTPLGIESTVVDLSGPRPLVLRHGGVVLEDLVDVVGPVDAPERRVVADDEVAAAPGGLLRHYAPATPLVLVEGDRLLADQLCSVLGRRGVDAVVVDLPADAPSAANGLYRALRLADGTDAAVLLAVVLPPAGMGRGVNDRLFRAAHGRVVGDDSVTTVDRLAQLARA